MKQAIAILLGVLVFLGLTFFIGYLNSTSQIQDTLDYYLNIVEGDIPDDLTLTIYYINPHILTRAPLSIEDLVNFGGVRKITVESTQLAAHLELLRRIKASVLQPVKEKTYLNARLYYIFETGDGDKLLEVAISEIYGNVFVNGIEVEHNLVFYEIILPFLSEEDRNTLGITTE